AYTMRLVTLIGGNYILTLKIGSVLFSVLIFYLCYLVGGTFFDRTTAIIFLLILETTPYFSIGSVFWHIDQPYMACWLIGMYTVGQYLKSKQSYWILLLGLVLGIGGMSKYIMILFPMSLLLWCFFEKEARKLLVSWQTYVGALVAVLIILPNLYWNYQHQWVTFTYNFEKGLTGAVFGYRFILFTLGQLILFSIFYSTYFWTILFRKKLNKIDRFSIGLTSGWTFLLVIGLVPIAFFSFTSLFGSRSDPHWSNVGYLALFLLLARYIVKQLEKKQLNKQLLLFFAAILFNVALTSVLLLQVNFRIFSVPNSLSSKLSVFVDWDKTARQIETIAKERQIRLPGFVITREYNLSGILALYLKHQPIPHSIEKPTRNVWSPVEKVLAQGALLICPMDECRKLVRKAEKRFNKELYLIGDVQTVRFGFVVRELSVYYLKPSH
ncbi:MAG: glycosyltransferase family 39 protein, partial [SAR324 cluster bacterium]|nr:glycosyltransferase family 39 protein [SAR324 cluster bacterium]